MKWDPYTLLVVLDKTGEAQGTLYVDDGETFDYQQGAYIHRQFVLSNGTLKSSDIGTKDSKTSSYLKSMKDITVERIIVVNAPTAWSSISDVTIEEQGVKEAVKTEMSYHPATSGKAAWAVVRNPGTGIGTDWTIRFTDDAHREL
jgi:alpha 1,3-glucosidase